MKPYTTFQREWRPRIIAGLWLAVILAIAVLLYTYNHILAYTIIWLVIVTDIGLGSYVLESIQFHTTTRLIYGYKNPDDATSAIKSGMWRYIYKNAYQYNDLISWYKYDEFGRQAARYRGDSSPMIYNAIYEIQRLFPYYHIVCRLNLHKKLSKDPSTKHSDWLVSKVDPTWCLRMTIDHKIEYGLTKDHIHQ